MFDPAGIGFAPREHRQFPVRPDFSKHRMSEENLMRMPQSKRGVQKRNDHEYAMKKTFIGGALALLVLAYPAHASAQQAASADKAERSHKQIAER
jgi:hypothetical protein